MGYTGVYVPCLYSTNCCLSNLFKELSSQSAHNNYNTNHTNHTNQSEESFEDSFECQSPYKEDTNAYEVRPRAFSYSVNFPEFF